MQNSNESTRDFNASAAIQFLTDLSPLLIVATTVTALLVIFLIDVTHLISVFEPKMGILGYVVAFLISCCILIARLAFGLLGASDVSNGAYISGIIGLSGTLCIAVFEHFALTHIATVWNMPEQIGLFQFIVWLAVGAELRLMMTLGNEKNILNRMKGKAAKKSMPVLPSKPMEWENFNYNHGTTNV